MVNVKKAYVNGRIYTVEGENWKNFPAEAIGTDENGYIVFVGNSNDLLEKCNDVEIINLEGNTVLPGFVDGHVHVPGMALMQLYEINLNGTHEKDETLSKIKAYVDTHPNQEHYFGSGFNMGMVDENGNPPCAAWLDEICRDKSLVLRSYDMHSRWVNTKAMEIAGVNRDTEDHGIGHVHKDKRGEPTGLFTDCHSILFPEQTYNREQQEKAMRKFMGDMNKWGYTTIMGVPPTRYIDQAMYKKMDENGTLTLRINCGDMVHSDYVECIDHIIEMRDTIESEKVKVTTAKFLVDGVIEGRTAYLDEPYFESESLDPKYRGKLNWEQDDLIKAVSLANRNGLQCHFHSIGDATTNIVLNAIEAAKEEAGDQARRNVITHLQLVRPEDKKRFGSLGVIAAIQPFWHFKEPNWFETVEIPSLGIERAEKEYPARSLVDNGAVITSSGDFPVSPENNPFFAIKAGVIRNVYRGEMFGVEVIDKDDPRFLLGPEERLSLEEMIEAYTMGGAYQLFREDEIGSIKIGKKADFIVLDRDIMNIDIMDVDRTEVLKTVLNGNVVYES